jgi:hypothetical protein
VGVPRPETGARGPAAGRPRPVGVPPGRRPCPAGPTPKPTDVGVAPTCAPDPTTRSYRPHRPWGWPSQPVSRRARVDASHRRGSAPYTNPALGREQAPGPPDVGVRLLSLSYPSRALAARPTPVGVTCGRSRRRARPTPGPTRVGVLRARSSRRARPTSGPTRVGVSLRWTCPGRSTPTGPPPWEWPGLGARRRRERGIGPPAVGVSRPWTCAARRTRPPPTDVGVAPGGWRRASARR